MSQRDVKLKSVIDMALSVLPHEIGCDDCFEYFAAYADHLTNGAAMPEPLRMVGEHLERCGSCMEELQFLLEAMKNAEQRRPVKHGALERNSWISR